MIRRYGRAPTPRRCLDRVPHGSWRTATWLAALRHDRLAAPLLIDGPLDGALFLAWVQQSLGPTLRAGDLVICDNLSSHKVAGVRAALAVHGAELLYLPAYSPDFNPIEQAFAKLKATLRAAAARNWDDLLQATAAALTTFTPTHCANFFRHAQYATTSIENALEDEPPGLAHARTPDVVALGLQNRVLTRSGFTSV